jgi:hypothetical protein
MTHALPHSTKAARKSGAADAQASNITDSHPIILGGLLAWLPALVILIGMPLVALTATKYVLLPSMKQIYAQQAFAEQEATPIFVAKIPLNPPGAHGVYTGFRSIALIGSDDDIQNTVNQNKAALTKLAWSDIQGKSVADLDKPGMLEALRAKLLLDFNHALGGPVVTDLYISVWPSR